MSVVMLFAVAVHLSYFLRWPLVVVLREGGLRREKGDSGEEGGWVPHYLGLFAHWVYFIYLPILKKRDLRIVSVARSAF